MPLKHIFAPAEATPKSIMLTSPDGFSTILRDQLPISTWLVAGASTYALLSVLLPKSSIYLAACLFAFLSYRIVSTVLQVYGIVPNPAMAQVIPGKTTAQVPDVNGNFTATPSKESVVVLLLGFKTNHPLGMLCPGYKETSDYFMNMLKSYDSPEGRREFGFLGMSSYLGASAAASNEVMTISYWRNIEGLHAFAESPVHREAWDWWNRTAKQHPHLLIFHEIYEAQGSSHENIYYNAAPMLIGGTAYPVKSDDKEESEWVTPLVEASRGVLASSRGRLGRRDQE